MPANTYTLARHRTVRKASRVLDFSQNNEYKGEFCLGRLPSLNLVRKISAYAGEEELAFRHRIPCDNKGSGRALPEKIATT
jgi:hypothetical protein